MALHNDPRFQCPGLRIEGAEMPIITLTTDFGRQDHYVAAMKGVILQLAPKTRLVDVTHQIRRHDVLQAAFVVRQVWPSFPAGTIHVVVVDPGVGTDRRIIVAQINGQIIVCPDNGIVSFLNRDGTMEMLRVVSNPRLLGQPRVSSTFHGRDIMAPLAGHLARGARLTDVGPATDTLEILDLPKPTRAPDRALSGEVIYVDGFGNLVTNLTRDDVAFTFAARPEARVWLGEHEIGAVLQTYAQVERERPLAMIGSTEMLEIAVNCGSAAEHFNAGTGTKVLLK
jgi:S-adenosylmethionine hydrolase